MPLFSRGFVRRRAISLATSLSVMATSFALAQAPRHQRHVLTASDIDAHEFLFDTDFTMSNPGRDVLTGSTADVDRDFTDVVISHHQGAIGIARAELKYGRDDALRQLAQRIVAQAEQDIPLMHGVKPAVAGSASPHGLASGAPN